MRTHRATRDFLLVPPPRVLTPLSASAECLGAFHEKKPYATGPSDVWALGTILCNLITGRNPWHIASPNEDTGFRIYLRKGPAWLVRNLPISLEAAAILSHIFELEPEKRITIPQLRDAILALKTFYPDDEVVSSSVKSATAAFKQPQGTQDVVPEVLPARVGRVATLQDVDITEARPANSSDFHGEGWELGPIGPASPMSANFLTMSPDDLTAAASATLAGTISTFVNDVSSSGDSDDTDVDSVWSISGPPPLGSSPEASSDNIDESESDGPLTPETYATDLVTSVPNLALDSSPHGGVPSEECDIGFATARLSELRTKAKGKKRRGSVTKIVEGIKKIKLRV